MPRPKTGSLWRDRKGRLYARITWTDARGRIYDKKRQAIDESHARFLCAAMLREVAQGKRLQPQRPKSYIKSNLLVYAIQLDDGHSYPVKIGTTSNLAKRVKMILTHQPYAVRVLAAWPGSIRDEKAIHAMFATSHLAREWFRPTPELLEYIASKTEAKAA